MVRAYEPELKRQSTEWRHEGSQRKQKFPHNPSPRKVNGNFGLWCQGFATTLVVRSTGASTILTGPFAL